MKVFPLAGVNYTEGMEYSDPARLIERCIEGDDQAIEIFVRRHETDIFRLAFSVLQDSSEAHEAAQDTFITALKALPNYQERSSLKAWLCTIALNVSRNRLRKRKVVEKLHHTLTVVFQIETRKQPTLEESVIETEKEKAVWNALNELDEKHRMIMVLRYFQELAIREIAEILSLSEGTVHSRLHTARERLRIALKEIHGDKV
ncbi:MAG TPA: RNA polymerase sigma factor [Anaerolineales bacterium]|nr:RNA polymerase sigma factor [Anaerolineales bacterium]